MTYLRNNRYPAFCVRAVFGGIYGISTGGSAWYLCALCCSNVSISSTVFFVSCCSSCWTLKISFTNSTECYNKKIVVAFWGMHVSPAKHSYAWLPRKCDYQTDTPDKVIPMCRYASQATLKGCFKDAKSQVAKIFWMNIEHPWLFSIPINSWPWPLTIWPQNQ